MHEKMYFNIINAIYDKITANLLFNGERLKTFFLSVFQFQFTTIQPSTGSPSQGNQARERNKGHPNCKQGKVKLSFFADKMKFLYRNSYSLYIVKKLIKIKKQIQQCFRINSQKRKISSIAICQ
jgi:hypothetical protein